MFLFVCSTGRHGERSRLDYDVSRRLLHRQRASARPVHGQESLQADPQKCQVCDSNVTSERFGSNSDVTFERMLGDYDVMLERAVSDNDVTSEREVTTM